MKDQPKDLQGQRDYLKIFCIAIAAFELLHSLYFLVDTSYILITYTNLYTTMAFLGTIIWLLTVVALCVGLWKGRPMLFIFWFFFAAIGTVTDIVYMVWNVTSSLTFDWVHFLRWTILYGGIVLECTGLYLVYSYYQRLKYLQTDTKSTHKRHRLGPLPLDLSRSDHSTGTTSYPGTDTKY